MSECDRLVDLVKCQCGDHRGETAAEHTARTGHHVLTLDELGRHLTGDAPPIRTHLVLGEPCDGTPTCGVDHNGRTAALT